MKCKYLLFAIIALASCSKEAPAVKELPALPSEASGKSTLSFRIRTDRQTTKASGYTETLPYESVVDTLQFLVFDSTTGNLNWYEEFLNVSGEVLVDESVELYYGKKTVYTLANGPSLKDVTTLSQLQSKTYNMKKYNSSDNMIMMAKDNITLGEDGEEVELYLDRMVARFYLNTVHNDLPPAYSSITVKKVLLGNVPSAIKWDGSDVSGVSYINPAGVLDNPVYAMTCKDVNKACANGGTCSPGTSLYTFHNPLNSLSTGLFISVLAEVGGEDYYYTVYLDPLDQKMNYASDLHIHIVGLGTKDPSKLVEKASISYTIEVREWQFASTYTETI